MSVYLDATPSQSTKKIQFLRLYLFSSRVYSWEHLLHVVFPVSGLFSWWCYSATYRPGIVTTRVAKEGYYNFFQELSKGS